MSYLVRYVKTRLGKYATTDEAEDFILFCDERGVNPLDLDDDEFDVMVCEWKR